MPRRYVPLVYRVAGMNAVLLVAAVVVTLLVLAPRKLSMFALDEAVILLAALGLVALVNLMILRRVVRPLEALTALARRVDLLGPGERIPHAEPTSEAGELSLTFNEMLARLEAERREATGRVLPEIDPQLADYALRELRGRGIDIRLETTLEQVGPSSARLSSGETLPTKTVVWTAGVAPQPILKDLNLPLDERGRVPVDEYLQVQGMDSVWAIGDCAAAPDPRGGTCPPTAQHAVRQGPVAANNIASRLGIGTPRPFEYRSEASFVNLGRYKAVGRIGDKTFRGFPAWWLARSYHMSQIPGPARKARAVLDWTASLPFKRDISEVGSIGHRKPLG